MDNRAEKLRNQKINYFVKSKFGNEISQQKPKLKIQSVDAKNTKIAVTNISDYVNLSINKKAKVSTTVYSDIDLLVDRKFISPQRIDKNDVYAGEAQLFIDFTMLAIDGEYFETIGGEQINTISG